MPASWLFLLLDRMEFSLALCNQRVENKLFLPYAQFFYGYTINNLEGIYNPILQQ